MLPATALALLVTGCSTDVYCSKQTGSSSTSETITHHFFVSGIKKITIDAAKICGGAENVVKQKPSNIRKWIARLYYFRHLYSTGSACIAHNNCMSCPSIWATLSALLINILLGLSSCFCCDQPFLWGEIIPFSGVCQSGRLHYPRRRRWWLHALTGQTALMCNRRRPAAHHHAEHHFQLSIS